jgi:hypothetical protein
VTGPQRIAEVQELTRAAADIVGGHDLPVVPADDTVALRQLDQAVGITIF